MNPITVIPTLECHDIATILPDVCALGGYAKMHTGLNHRLEAVHVGTTTLVERIQDMSQRRICMRHHDHQMLKSDSTADGARVDGAYVTLEDRQWRLTRRLRDSRHERVEAHKAACWGVVIVGKSSAISSGQLQ